MENGRRHFLARRPTRVQAAALGGLPVKHFLTKPFSIEDLLMTVRSVLAEPPTS
jgi:DNA-binding response OmpR family regulator